VSGDNLKVVPLGRPVIQVACAYQHTCVLLDDNTVRCFGNGALGRLGYGDGEAWTNYTAEGNIGNLPGQIEQLPPVFIQNGVNVSSISCGIYHCCCKLSDSTVKCFGSGAGGLLGQDNSISYYGTVLMNQTNPINVGGPVQEIVVGHLHTCVLLSTSEIKCWGANFAGELGMNPADFSYYGDQSGQMASLQPILFDATVKYLAAGQYVTCGIYEHGGVSCWGKG